MGSGAYVQDLSVEPRSIVAKDRIANTYNKRSNNIKVDEDDWVKHTRIDDVWTSLGYLNNSNAADWLIENIDSEKFYRFTVRAYTDDANSPIISFATMNSEDINLSTVEQEYSFVSTGLDDTNYFVGICDTDKSIWIHKDMEFEEVSAVKIANYTEACRTTLKNTNYGLSNLLLEQDASGRATGAVAPGTIAVDDSGKNVATQWVIGGDFYTITQIVSGELQDFGIELYDNTTTAINITYSAGLVECDGLGGSTDGRIYLNTNTELLMNDNYHAVIIASNVVGTPIINGYHNGGGWVSIIPYTIKNGTNTIPLTGIDELTMVLFQVDVSNVWGYTEEEVSVKELTTKTQRQEFRRFVKDSVNGNSYYMDDALQDVTPLEPTGELKAERIASIGHSDTVTRHHGEPMVYSRAITPDPALLAWKNENDEVYIDENSEIWTTN